MFILSSISRDLEFRLVNDTLKPYIFNKHQEHLFKNLTFWGAFIQEGYLIERGVHLQIRSIVDVAFSFDIRQAIEKTTNLHYNLLIYLTLDHIHFFIGFLIIRGKNEWTYSIISSTKIDSWEFSFCLPASLGRPFLKQWIKPSFVETRRKVPIPLKRGFIFPPLIIWWTPSLSYWSCSLVILALNGFFHHASVAWINFVHPPGMITLSLFISFTIFSHAVSHMTFVRVPS